MPTLNAIHRYPVKGFPGETLSATHLTAGAGLPDDRRYAVTNGISNTLDGAWLTCRSFFINAVNDRLLKYANESRGDEIILASPGGLRLSWKKGDAGKSRLRQPEDGGIHSTAPANRRLADAANHRTHPVARHDVRLLGFHRQRRFDHEHGFPCRRSPRR